MRIGFDEEASQMDTKNLLQHIVDLRNPSRITLGLRPIPGDGTLPNAYVAKEVEPTPVPPPASASVAGLGIRKSPGRSRNKGLSKHALYYVVQNGDIHHKENNRKCIPVGS